MTSSITLIGRAPDPTAAGWMRAMALLLPLAVLIGACKPTPVGPRAVFDAIESDAGRVWQGEDVRQTFRFTNKGSEDLVIDRLDPSCDCLAAAASIRVPPEARSEVAVTVRTHRLSGASTQQVVLSTNVRGQPMIVLRVRVHVQPEVVVSPSVVDFKSVEKGTPTRQEVTVQIHERSPARLVRVGATADHVSVRWLSNGSRRHRVVLEPASTHGPGPVFGNLVLTTSSPLMPELRIPIRGQVVSTSHR